MVWPRGLVSILFSCMARRDGRCAAQQYLITLCTLSTLSDLLSLSLSLLAACAQIATQLNRPSIRVVHMEAGVTADNVRSQLKGGLASAVLLDSKGGGTGKTFDWEVGGEVQQKVPFILAGGLTPLNVEEAVRQVRPWCVDVSSGVESDGAKDPAKIAAFVAGAKKALGA